MRLEDVSGRAWLRMARAQKCIAGCEGGARKAGHRQKAHVHVVRTHAPRAVLSEGSVKLQQLRAGWPLASGSQRNNIGVVLSGAGIITY